MDGGVPGTGLGHGLGRELILRMRERGVRDLRARIERVATNAIMVAFGAGVAGAGVLVAVLRFVLSSFDRTFFLIGGGAVTLLDVVLVVVCGVAAAYAADRAVRRNEKRQIRSELEYCMYHLRRVLFAEGLLALVLSEDPFDAVPGLGRVVGIRGSELLARRGGPGGAGLERRLKALADHYGLICRHYRIEPWPKVREGGVVVFPARLRDTPFAAFALVLAEEVLGEATDVDDVLTASTGRRDAGPTRG